MSPSDAVRACATAIRPYLPDLVGLGWEDVDRELADLLEPWRSGLVRDADIVNVLERHERTRTWSRRFLGDDALSETAATTRGRYAPMAGTNALRAPVYVCPACGYRWVQQDAEERVPRCSVDVEHPPLAPVKTS
jgi:hypothetical protein